MLMCRRTQGLGLFMMGVGIGLVVSLFFSGWGIRLLLGLGSLFVGYFLSGK